MRKEQRRAVAAKGGRTVLKKYGREHFAALARTRWNKKKAGTRKRKATQ